jgi:DNA primase
MKVTAGRLDWKVIRETIDLVRVATEILQPPAGARTERGGKVHFLCPFHDDHHPSLVVDPVKRRFKCWPCGAYGDAATLVMKVAGVPFPEAVGILVDGSAIFCQTSIARKPSRKPTPTISGLAEAEATALVESAVAYLWSPDGAEALAYLTGSRRGLTVETIRSARLGWTSGVMIPKADGKSFRALGVTIPWFRNGKLALLKIRQPDGRRPKYAEAFRDPARVGCYPGMDTIQPGRPLLVAEGEFDSLLLGQDLSGLASVITLGAASGSPCASILAPMLATSPWFIATDNDDAGDEAAAKWPDSSLRIRPPGAFNDWTELKAHGVNLRRWWTEVFAGVEHPRLFTWEEARELRWGSDAEKGEPGLDVFPPTSSKQSSVTRRPSAPVTQTSSAVRKPSWPG